MFLSGFLGFVWFPSKEGGCSRNDFAIPWYFYFVYKTAKTHSQCPTRNGTSSRFPFIVQSLSHFNELCQVKASYELLTADRLQCRSVQLTAPLFNFPRIKITF